MSVWQIATSSAAGALITLIGVFAGAALTGRNQQRHWVRDKQIHACSDIIAESSRIQRALWRRWAHGDEVQWDPWNEALAALWLFGESDLIDAAGRIDEGFYRHSQRIKNGELAEMSDWMQARDDMEADRLDFINEARAQVLKANGAPITKALGRRPKPTVTPQPDSQI